MPTPTAMDGDFDRTTARDRFDRYLRENASPAVPPELEAALAMRKQSLGGYSSPQAQGAFAEAQRMSQGAEAQRRAQLAQLMTRNQIASPSSDRLAQRLNRQSQQAFANRAQQLAIENIGMKNQMAQNYEKGALGIQQLKNQRTFMDLAGKLASEQIGAATNSESYANDAASKYLLALLAKKD